MNHSAIRLVLQLNDIHCGSTYGLVPPKFRLPDAENFETEELPPMINVSDSGIAYYNQNRGQRYLWDCWKDTLEKVKWYMEKLGLKKLDGIVINGDGVDGRGQASRGAYEHFILDTTYQSAALVECLAPFNEITEKIYWVRGNEYHDQIGGLALEQAAVQLDKSVKSGGKHGRMVLRLAINDKIAAFAHQGGFAQVYYATVPEKQGMFASLTSKMKNKGIPNPDIIGLADLHIWVHVEHMRKHMFIGGAYQLQTPYMMRAGKAFRSFPDLGCTLIEYNPDSKRAKMSGDPLDIVKIGYTYPPVSISTL